MASCNDKSQSQKALLDNKEKDKDKTLKALESSTSTADVNLFLQKAHKATHKPGQGDLQQGEGDSGWVSQQAKVFG